jgi:TolA-binding protein
MKNLATGTLKVAARRTAAAVLFLLTASAVASAQGAPGGSGAPGRTNPKDETQGRASREARLRSAELEAATVGQLNQRQLAAAIEQTKNDFKRIQLVRNELVDLLVSKQPFEYKQLAGQAEEINKRAHRLKSFLMKPPPEATQPPVEKKPEPAATPVYDEAGMRSALVKLCNTIHSFTGNPMFKNPDVIDAAQPVKAGGELLTIIDLSESVKLNAERMAKASK